MDEDLCMTVQELKDRQEIYECLMLYCRAMDRLDRELLLSCYHPDGIDDHDHYVGPAEGFADWALSIYAQFKLSSHHEITNHYCELDGDTAHAESYWTSSSANTTEPYFSLARGRYIDRFEKRGGRWAIAERKCIVEFSDGANAAGEGMPERKYSPRDRTDAAYMRPFKVDRSRFTV